MIKKIILNINVDDERCNIRCPYIINSEAGQCCEIFGCNGDVGRPMLRSHRCIEAENKYIKMHTGLMNILEMDERSMYERCPECDYDSCAENKQCKIVPRSSVGVMVLEVLQND